MTGSNTPPPGSDGKAPHDGTNRGVFGSMVASVSQWTPAMAAKRVLFTVAMLVFLFYLPLPWMVNSVREWLYDCCYGVFYNPEREGLISVASPQLFTRERLVNQRLEESAWLDGRIKDVEDQLEKKEFATYSYIANKDESVRAVTNAGTPPRETAGASGRLVEETTADDETVVLTEVRTPPLQEFKQANYYRQHLVQEKFQSILDDAHDTSSNTLQRLNFDLSIAPARRHSTSVAAVSVTLEQPKDPEWILQKYGELLFDVREELQEITTRMIADRQSIFRIDVDGDYTLNAETASLLKRELAERNRSDTQTDIATLKSTAFDQYLGNTFFALRQHLMSIGEDPAIGAALVEVFFPNNNRWTPEMGGRMLETCSTRSTSIWALLPRNATKGPKYTALEQTYAAYQNAQGNDQDPGSALKLRQLLADSRFSAPCPPPTEERLRQGAMIELLGRYFLEVHRPLDPDRECTDETWNAALLELKSGLGPEKAKAKQDILQKCGPILHERKEAARAAGLVQLVKAELENTPVDTAGRLRRLSDYFSISDAHCDWNSCELVILTKAEHSRRETFAKLETLLGTPAGKRQDASITLSKIAGDSGCNELTSASTWNDGDIRRAADECALNIGRQEALRLFAELSCFASARSYTIYPREGMGRNVLERSSQNWSLLSVFGQNRAERTSLAEEARVRHTVPILGMGDMGSRDGNWPDERQPIECGEDFLKILNTLDIREPLTNALRNGLNNSWRNADPKFSAPWKNRMKCLLNTATAAAGNLETFETGAEACTTAEVGKTYTKDADEFDLSTLTMVVRHLREQSTTISWIVFPQNEGLWGTSHVAQSFPLSAIVSLPSWWPGAQIVTQTCWQRPMRLGLKSGRSLCPEPERPPESESSARVESRQIMPLPTNIEDVLPKLGFFLIRYPYLDRQDTQQITLESGREATLRLSGKRLWKNPRVRLGEQWSTRIEVMPDMRGIIATFDCVAPLANGNGPTHQDADMMQLASTVAAPENEADPAEDKDGSEETGRYHEARSARVWTSEGNTQILTVLVSPFRPRYALGGEGEWPCWAEKERERQNALSLGMAREREKQAAASK
ncbi:hypothetical protein [Chachezhania antarctica]|uniref:hypothetical protein n=1 Tax=Chachezhania antarctica TaxID=2340860 RepID=UPI000EABBDCD|nr:hypothetical protein [Chachezhania antarctica]